MKQNLLFNRASAIGKRLAMVLTMLLIVGIGQAWGADYSKNESWAFTTSGNTNWSGHNSGYCGACGNKSSSFNVYKTNITNFSNIDFSKYENVSLTIYVKAGTNSGTNSYTVKLINASGNQVSTYTSTKTNGMGTGSSSSYAKESSVTFNPTMAFSGYKIEFPAKAYITQTRYVLTYDDKTVSYTINWTINPTAGGLLSATSGNSTTVNPNAAYTYGAPAYTVTSGSATVSQSGNTFTATPTANSTIQINMVEKPKYTVTFDAGSNGTCSTTSLTETSAGAGVTLPNVTPNSGYRFLGWATSSSATTANAGTAGATYKPTSNITLYAVYKQQCTITWLVDGNAAEGSPTTKVDKGGKVTTLPTTPTLDCSGKVFVGWSNQEVTDGNKPSVLFTDAASSPAINANITFYAVFAKKETTPGSSISTPYKFEITSNNFNTTSYAANNNEKTTTAKATDGSNATLDVKWTSNQVMKQSSAMQWQKNAGYIFNSTDLGTINSVTITSTAGTFTTYYGTTSQPSSGSKGDGKGYFKTSVGGATGTTSKVAITFTKTITTDPTTKIYDYTTQCTTQTVVTLIPKITFLGQAKFTHFLR